MLGEYDKTSKTSILEYANQFLNKDLSEILSENEIKEILEKSQLYKRKRKGFFGDVVEEYLFKKTPDNISKPDFDEAGLELKTSPLYADKKKKYKAKERLSFSMIDYRGIICEKWEESSFLKKNQALLLMLYLYKEDVDVDKYKFKIIHFLDLLSHLSSADVAQIKKDWNFIVAKIKRGEAHLLSEGDTSYLGAATKGASSKDRTPQPNNDIDAKPRAFSLKQSYLNILIQNILGKEDKNISSIFSDESLPKTIEENIEARVDPYIGKTIATLETELGIEYVSSRVKKPKKKILSKWLKKKNITFAVVSLHSLSILELEKVFAVLYTKTTLKHRRRYVINRLLGAKGNKIEELEKADITLRVIALQPTGTLKESISFPCFKYTEIVKQEWEDSAFYEILDSRKFLFVVFKKQKNKSDILKVIKFWNFPMKDIGKAQDVWEETVKRIKNHNAKNLPGIAYNGVAHVRPHGKNKKDTLPTGYGTEEVKKSFWLNAKYIQKIFENEV